MTPFVAALVALAVVAACGPPVRRLPCGPGRPGPGRSLPPGPVGRTRRPRTGGRPREDRTGPAATPCDGAAGDLATVLHAVASQLRAGVPPPDAWRSVLGVPGADDGTPPAPALLAVGRVGRGAGRVGARRAGGRDDAAHRARVRAVLAGTRVAAETGAPLADVLADLADAVAADAEQSADLAAALAGPRATGRVLVLLPVLGLLVGAAIGARPWAVLTGGGVGSALGAAGLVLAAAGHAWVRALLRRAVVP
ncbi:type II secretion system F family protein [Cellulomonas iranensis]|uniref:type II secretion system F family protein n=1 Tax=Cellulomonas iranensis TaxID=76862 RepID=UPI0015C68E49|nr:type II secretion system F family protein [Cellulomonas iranensis]